MLQQWSMYNSILLPHLQRRIHFSTEKHLRLPPVDLLQISHCVSFWTTAFICAARPVFGCELPAPEIRTFQGQLMAFWKSSKISRIPLTASRLSAQLNDKATSSFPSNDSFKQQCLECCGKHAA